MLLLPGGLWRLPGRWGLIRSLQKGTGCYCFRGEGRHVGFGEAEVREAERHVWRGLVGSCTQGGHMGSQVAPHAPMDKATPSNL